MIARSSDNDTATRGHDRRRYERYETHLPAQTLRHNLASTRAARCHVDVNDFSLGGLRAQSPVRMKVDERLTVRLPQSGTKGPVHLTGRVTHCRRRDDRYDVGIEFTETQDRHAASPWRQLPRLFSMAHQTTGDGRVSH